MRGYPYLFNLSFNLVKSPIYIFSSNYAIMMPISMAICALGPLDEFSVKKRFSKNLQIGPFICHRAIYYLCSELNVVVGLTLNSIMYNLRTRFDQ